MASGATGARSPDGRRRAVVTGLGAVTSAGWGVPAFHEAACSGRTALGTLTRFPHDTLRTDVAGEVPDPPAHAVWLARFRRYSYADRFAVFAATEAITHAGLPRTLADRLAGIFFASSTGGLLESERYYADLVGGAGNADRTMLASHHLCAPAETVARHLHVTGPVETISSACASAGLAIEQALQSIRSAEVDIAIAGGADGLSLTTYAGFHSLRAMDEQPCRPFRAERMGMSLGEGGAVLVLEGLDHALARGASPLAEVLGAGSTCDAHHMTAPQEAGLWAAAAMRAAIADAGLSADDVDYLNAHGTGTPLNDAAEFAAMRLVFGDRASAIPVEASKSIVGHLLGAAGAIGAISTVLGLRHQVVHPTAGQGEPDRALPVDLVYDRPRAVSALTYALSSSLGFGGVNASVLLGRWIPA